MIVQKGGDKHTHELRKAYKTVNNTNGVAYILMRICVVKGCTYKEAYDLVHYKPSGG